MLEAYQDPRTRRAGRGSSAHPLGRSATKPGYETLGTTGLPKFNMNGRASLPKRAQTVPGPGNFRLKPNDPRLDPRSSHYNVALARAYKEQQLKEAQHLQLVKQAEAERARKLELERQALEDERSRNLIDAQLYREKKLKEEARAKAAGEAARKAHEHEVAAKRQELDHVRTLEEIREQEEQLDYLEQLLTRNPRAAIPGLDPARLNDDPDLLKHVLRLVEENIRKPEAARHSARLLQEAMQQERANRERHAKLVRQEQELNRLEALLTQHPQATIKGLDMTKVNSDPNILAHALRQVEEYIQRGENPIEIPINVPSVERLNEAHPRMELKEEERRLAQQFLSAAEDIQLAHLRSLPNPSSREFFLRMALHEADLAQAQEIVNRFRPLDFDIHIPPGVESRVRTPQPSRPPVVPIIVVEQAKSPPPTQDTGPSFPFPDMRTASGPPQTGSSNEWQDKTRDASMPTLSPVAHNVIDEYSPSLPHLPTPPASTPGRTSAAHPSGAVAAAAAADMAAELEKKAEEADLAAQEAELERERRELVEAEEAILRAEHEQALAEVQRRADEEALAALQAQDEARALAAAQMEEAAQEQARQMAAAQAAEEALWGAGDTHVPVEELGTQSPMMPTLPTPPLPSEELICGNDAWSSVAGDPVDEAPNIQNDSAWGEAIAQVDANTSSPKSAKTASPAASKAAPVKSLPASAQSTPKASRAGVSPAASIRSKVSSKPASSARQTPFASPKVPSMSTSPAALDAALSLKAASVKSPSVKAASPLAASVKAPSPAIEAVLSPAARSVRSEKASSPLSGKQASPPAASPTSAEKTVTPLQRKTPTPVPSVHSTPKAATPIIPKTPTPVQARELTPVLAKTPTPVASPARSATSGAVTPKAAPPAVALDAWGSPVINKSVSASGTPRAAPDAWGSPVNKAVSTGVTPKAVSDAWGSPAVKAASPAGQGSPARPPSVASPTKSKEAWGATSPARSVKAPSVAGPHKNNDVWGAASPARTASPRLQPRNSPAPAAGSLVFSPAKSQTSKTGSGRSKVMSPAFGLDRGDSATQIDPGEPEHVEGPKTAIKGSDPVVVSMVEPATPYEPTISQPMSGEPIAAGVATTAPPVGPDPNYPNEEYEDYSDEEEDDRPHVDPNFDPADFPIFMLHEPLDEGLTLLMDPPPHPFQEQYPKATPEVTGDGVLNHMATLAQ